MIAEFLIVIVGVIIILLLAEVIIKNAIELAKHYGFSGTFIGLTILSIGTSVPEIMTHIIGSVNILKNPGLMNTLSGLLIGTNVGSDIFQETFVLAIIGIVGTIVVIKKNLFVEVGGLIAAALLTWLFCLGGIVNRWEGAILLVAYLAYLIYLKNSRISESFNALNHLPQKLIVWSFGLIILSFIIMAFVADEVLDASTVLVETLPISASFFGVILLGVASALPELTTSLIAILKGRKHISAGILIGSNITNPLFGLGLGALISTYTVPNVTVFYDLPFKIGVALLIFYFLWRRKDIGKAEGITLIILFLLYILARNLLFPVDF